MSDPLFGWGDAPSEEMDFDELPGEFSLPQGPHAPSLLERIGALPDVEDGDILGPGD